MTTIVIDLKNKEVAADRQRTLEIGAVINRSPVTKIHQPEDGVIFVGCGSSTEIEKQLHYFISNGRVYSKPTKDVKLAICKSKGDTLIVDIYSYKPPSFLGRSLGLCGSFERETVNGGSGITLGSGSDYAMGAFRAGKSAAESVRVASMCDEFTSYEVDVFNFDSGVLSELQ